MLIFTYIKQYINIIIAVAIAGGSFWLASIYYNHKIDKINNAFSTYQLTTEKNIEAQKASILSQQNALKEENLKLVNNLKDLENEKFKTYTALQKANSIIKSNIANGTSSLYIHASCPKPADSTSGETKDPKSSSMDDGKTPSVAIDSRDATAIISITEKADQYKSQLEGLQDWVNMLISENNK